MSPLLSRRRVLAAKIETTPGTAQTLAVADAALNVFDAQMQPDIDFEAREGQGAFSPLAGVPGALAGTCTFQTELVGGGTLPFWASVLAPACGLVASGLVLAPKSEAPETSVKTVTLGLYQDGLLKRLRGAMGTIVFRFAASRPVRLEWSFRGIWDPPTDLATLSPTYPTTAPLKFTSSALALGSWQPKVSELTLDLGNQVFVREDSREASGLAHAVIVGRQVKGTLNPEASLVATKDVYGDWLARTEAALAMSLGAAGNQVSFAGPKLQFTKVAGADREGVLAEAVEFVLNRSASAGDDELTITCA